jgi:uncharacterized protein (DUF427 family)
MARAIWNGSVLAESDSTVLLEGNHYFPQSEVRIEFLKPSERTTTCPWKGIASYYDVIVDGAENPGAAWYYADPKPAASEIKNRIGFWKGVAVR